MAIKGEGTVFELIRTPEDDRDAWLDLRKKGIGGSDVAAIMGLSAFRSAYSVWAEKSGLYQPEDISDKPAVHWGNILEPIVGGEYAENHQAREVRRVNAVCRNLKRPWAQASLDYEVKDPVLGWGVLEIKTAGAMRAKDWDDGVPVYYQTQVVHYLSVTGRPFADVAVLIGGSDYREYRIMRDAEDEAAVVGAVDAFWCDHILKGEPPEITGARDDGAAVFAVSGMGGKEVPFVDMSQAMADYISAKYAKSQAEEAFKDASNRLKKEIGQNAALECDAGKFSWRRYTVNQFDKKAFEADHPDLADQYSKMAVRDGGIVFKPRKE